jgi:hypothetical protein
MARNTVVLDDGEKVHVEWSYAAGHYSASEESPSHESSCSFQVENASDHARCTFLPALVMLLFTRSHLSCLYLSSLREKQVNKPALFMIRCWYDKRAEQVLDDVIMILEDNPDLTDKEVEERLNLLDSESSQNEKRFFKIC